MVADTCIPGRVSVIIPTYNYSRYIPSCLDSVFSQAVNDLEIIVVDDGSSDDTKAVLTPYMDRIRYIYQENSGLSAARNTGIKVSTGEYIQFLDSDDILGQNAIKTKIEFLKTKDASIAVCRNKIFLNTDKDGLPVVIDQWPLYATNLDAHLCFFNIAPPHAFLSRREVIAKTGDFDTSLRACEDYDYWLRAAVLGYPPVYCPNGLVYYRQHPLSMSEDRTNQYYHDAILHQRLFGCMFQKKNYPASKSLMGKIAFLAGLTTTINRLETIQQHQEMILTLQAMLFDVSENIASEELSNYQKWDIATRMYFYIFSINVKRMRFLPSNDALPDALKKLQGVVNFKFHLSSLLNYLGATGEHKREKQVMRHLVKVKLTGAPLN